MYIKSVSIKNFRNFEDMTINFCDGYQTIIGENNIGKTNLLFAIRLVLDRQLSYKVRNLKIKDFNGYEKPCLDNHIMISVELSGVNLDSHPLFHCLKISNDTMRVTYVYAHKNKFDGTLDEMEECKIEDFNWQLYGGGNSLKFEEIVNSQKKIYLRNLDGINVFYLNDFRNIYSDLRGKNQSLLSNYCQSRENSDDELEKVSSILKNSTEQLNDLSFIPKMERDINTNNLNIAGDYFSPSISLGFSSDFDEDIWNELELLYKPVKNKEVPIKTLGLGEKNLLYLTLFIAELENEKELDEINIVLIEEPEAHLHPQLQKILFSNLQDLSSTQVLMTSHSTHIASDCKFKNLSLLYEDENKKVDSFSPFLTADFTYREENLLKRYLDATRSELFFSSAVILVEGVAEQFIIPAICEKKFGIDLAEYNISIIPIYGRHFSNFMKFFQDKHLEIPVAVIIDGDKKEIEDEEQKYTTAVKNALALEIEDRVEVFNGEYTLEIDLFPYETNEDYLRNCFIKLGHNQSYNDLIKYESDKWSEKLITKIDKTIKKGRFAQQLTLEIDKEFEIPSYIEDAIRFIARKKGIELE
ncbi:ATP-dependent nuclease [Halanaerobaculum tunisiense]